ncbi:alpha/beta fold hydrolase [Streptomyces yangpuensis]|uniref:Alpha/beta fold hydrolase n=1 Tax=Streptomyces yangpuensis TaxID=1648182 RepID=A0ABY5Q2I3_9ACTN|nr:alpha/beta fold hydrolase [Streptomyces yangpuensis]UUY50631.1 alpha/beta fold hydrolase [Streptomyces yangpuensis]
MIPSVEVTTRAVRAEDGATAEVRLHRRPGDPSAPVLVCLPAMGTRAAAYSALADALAGAGFQVAVGELRGQGTSSVRVRRGVRYGYHEMVAYDYPALFRAVEAAFPGAPRYLLGHSLGGQLGVLYLSQEPHMAAGAVLVGAPSCHYRGWPFPQSVGMLAAFQLAAAFSAVYGYFPGRRIGILGNDSAQVLRDMATQVRTGRYQVPSSAVDFEAALAKLDLPVLAVAVKGDAMAPPGGVRGLAGKLTGARVTHWELALGDGVRGSRHYAWIRDSAALVERVRAFVDGA